MKNNRFKYISVAALDDRLEDVTIAGLKYPLKNAALLRHEPMGVSNEFIGPEAEITIKKGNALIIYSRD